MTSRWSFRGRHDIKAGPLELLFYLHKLYAVGANPPCHSSQENFSFEKEIFRTYFHVIRPRARVVIVVVRARIHVECDVCSLNVCGGLDLCCDVLLCREYVLCKAILGVNHHLHMCVKRKSNPKRNSSNENLDQWIVVIMFRNKGSFFQST